MLQRVLRVDGGPVEPSPGGSSTHGPCSPRLQPCLESSARTGPLASASLRSTNQPQPKRIRMLLDGRQRNLRKKDPEGIPLTKPHTRRLAWISVPNPTSAVLAYDC